jgi:Na+/H+ antiporter NhaD/arsenite permease-like protein
VPDRAQLALAVFALTYAVLGFGALKPFKLDRTGASLVGATAMIALGVLSPRRAVAAVDFQTIALLFGMMIVVAHLRLAGFFGWVGSRALRWAHAPGTLLALMVVLAGVVSALFVNDTACLLLTPLALEIAAIVRRRPLPFLLAVAMGSNAGSVATLVGNPQNMIVASFSGISYARFSTMLAPVAVASLAATIAALRWFYRADLGPGPPVTIPRAAHVHRALLVKSLIVAALLLVALVAGAPPGLAALAAASVLLVTRRLNPERVYSHVNWGLLAMFAGLFVVVAGVEEAGLVGRALGAVPVESRRSLGAFVIATTALSNLVSNVPAVLVLKSWAGHLAPPERAWLLLAMASTLAGNLTLVGSVANLIVVEQARGRADIGFCEYARVGVPLSIVTLAIGYFWVALATR